MGGRLAKALRGDGGVAQRRVWESALSTGLTPEQRTSSTNVTTGSASVEGMSGRGHAGSAHAEASRSLKRTGTITATWHVHVIVAVPVPVPVCQLSTVDC